MYNVGALPAPSFYLFTSVPKYILYHFKPKEIKSTCIYYYHGDLSVGKKNSIFIESCYLFGPAEVVAAQKEKCFGQVPLEVVNDSEIESVSFIITFLKGINNYTVLNTHVRVVMEPLYNLISHAHTAPLK